MNSYFRSFILVLLLWVAWHIILFVSGTNIGVETINRTFVRVAENFTSTAFLLDIFLFYLAQISLVALLAVFVWWAFIGLTEGAKVNERLALTIAFILNASFVHVLNSVFSPLSKTAFPIEKWWADPLLAILATVTLFFIIIAFLRSASARKGLLVSCVCFVLPYALIASTITQNGTVLERSNQQATELSNELPNIFIIGVDALRPSELAREEGQVEVMPFLSEILTQAETYSPAYTPVARTHAAWISILSGEYPLHNGARFNLMDDSYIDKEALITRKLNAIGYHNVWALDERRFNSIDESYGFDRVVGPKVGAADFLITKFSDIPLVNILANTSIAKVVFPYIYNNRGNYVTYVPYNFNRDVVAALNAGRPNFLSVHFCLPHYPFVSNLMERIDYPLEDVPVTYPNYLSMLNLADKQIEDLFNRLAKNGELENAIVYLVSDHGEGFPGVDKPLQSGNPFASFKTELFGHGTSVMSLKQYEVLLARLRFKDGVIVSDSESNKNIYSLVDVAADISDTLNLKMNLDGVPLDEETQNRKVVLESSFSTEAVSASRIDEIRVLQQTVDSYKLDDKGRLVLRPSLYSSYNSAKQRAVISASGKMVALYPDEKTSAFLVDTKSGVWWPSEGDFPGPAEKWQGLLDHLCSFYSKDSSFQNSEICIRGFSGKNSEVN